MRCSNCNKFVPYDTEIEPEEARDSECDGTVFKATYRRVLSCEECGDELKEADIDVEHDFASVVVEPDDEEEDDEGDDKEEDEEHEHEHEFEVDSCDVEPTTESRGPRGRRAKTFYGVMCQVEVSCACGATAEFEASADVQASDMDELQ